MHIIYNNIYNNIYNKYSNTANTLEIQQKSYKTRKYEIIIYTIIIKLIIM